MEKRIKVSQFVRILPETRLKLQLLAIGMKVHMGELVDLMVDNLWEHKKDLTASLVTSQKANKKAKKIFEKMKL